MIYDICFCTLTGVIVEVIVVVIGCIKVWINRCKQQDELRTHCHGIRKTFMLTFHQLDICFREETCQVTEQTMVKQCQSVHIHRKQVSPFL